MAARKRNDLPLETPISQEGEVAYAAFCGESVANVTKKTSEARASVSNKLARLTGGRGSSLVCEDLKNIDNLSLPYHFDGNFADVAEFVELSQKAYSHISSYKNAIEIPTEFANSNIHLSGGTKKGRDFFYAWLNRINSWNLKDQFFREWFRSSNVIMLRIDGNISTEEILKLGQIYGSEESLAAESFNLPIRYLMLNPADVSIATSFLDSNNSVFYRAFNQHELKKMQTPVSQTEIDFVESLPEEAKKALKSKNSGASIKIPMDRTKIHAVFAKKQDYEPFAQPIFFPVLKDLNLKLEFKRADFVAARSIEYFILLVKAGDKDDKTTNKKLTFLQNLFASEEVGRVLVADYTTTMEYIIPDINKILGPEKYQEVDQDIREGLTNVFFGEEKYASANTKIKVFTERLNEARRGFLNEFLQPEIKRISKMMGFKSYPVANFDEIDLNDEAIWGRIYAQLTQLGILTPEEGINALGTGRMPTPEESLESQKRFRDYRADGLYMPLVGAQGVDQGGRPQGTISPAGSRETGQVGTTQASQEKDSYSSLKLIGLAEKAVKLEESLGSLLKEKHGLKRFSKKQKECFEGLFTNILSNCSPEEWNDPATAEAHLSAPQPINHESFMEIGAIKSRFDISERDAAFLYWSKLDA